MRVNVYAEEMTNKVELIKKVIDGREFTGLRFYLELPVTKDGEQIKGPFMHHPGDDDSSAVTFWGKRYLRGTLRKALGLLNEHYDDGYDLKVSVVCFDEIPEDKRDTILHDAATALQQISENERNDVLECAQYLRIEWGDGRIHHYSNIMQLERVRFDKGLDWVKNVIQDAFEQGKKNNEKLRCLEDLLHSKRMHPEYEYQHVVRDGDDIQAPVGDNWERHVDDEVYFRRKR